MTEDGGTLFELRNSADGEWYEFLNVPMQDSMNTMPLGFSKDGTIMYAKDATGRDTSALVSMPARKGGAEQATIIFESGDFHLDGMRSVGPGIAQNPDAMYGKMITVDMETGEGRILSMGHRNAQGIATLPDGTVLPRVRGQQPLVPHPLPPLPMPGLKAARMKRKPRPSRPWRPSAPSTR